MLDVTGVSNSPIFEQCDDTSSPSLLVQYIQMLCLCVCVCMRKRENYSVFFFVWELFDNLSARLDISENVKAKSGKKFLLQKFLT